MPVAVVACVLLGIALWEANASSQVGQAVSGAQAADVRAGACPKCKQSTCPAGACPARTVVVFDAMGINAMPRGTQYCGNYWWYMQACYN